MKGSNSLMEWVVKLIFFLMLLPFFVSLALGVLSAAFQVMLAFFIAILPWLIGLALLMAIVAGVSTGLVLRRRLPPRNGNKFPPSIPPVRRPRGHGQDDED